MHWYAKSAASACLQLGCDIHNGLSGSAVEQSRRRYGKNALEQRRQHGLLYCFAKQLCDFMIIVLLAAAVLSYITSLAAGQPDPTEPLIILAIVLINAAVGVFQQSRAQHAIAALQKITAPVCRVIREGKRLTIPSEQLVCGDLLLIKSGELVPADARLISCSGLRTEESALTGESAAVDKSSGVTLPEKSVIAEHINMLYSGTAVVSGNGTAVVTAVGMDTQLGKIAGLMQSVRQEDTPLQKRLAGTGRLLGITALIICLAVFVLGLINGEPPLATFMLAVSLAVAAIPEGLPAIVTIVLALGVSGLARQKAIIRRLPAVETLGCTTVICADKTGTLTQNKMTVTTLLADNVPVTAQEQKGQQLLKYAALCCNAELSMDNGQRSVTGEPTEIAIVEAAASAGLIKTALCEQYKRLDELPFCSERKLMSTLHESDGGYIIITKGAPELLLRRCSISAAKRAELLRRGEQLAADALRVIGVAIRPLSQRPVKIEESELTFIGMIGMHDPPRAGVPEAVRSCKSAGIRPIMITGDHAVTALAVARAVGIPTAAGAVNGEQLEHSDDTALRAIVGKCSVFARVTPEHKQRLVHALRARGEVVAMTGDGVNDAPALARADIGCAMGRSGTQVAREAADMILVDDNFSTIVAAVREGRGIYDNIRRAVHFLLSCNIGEIITVFAASLFHFESTLFAIQLLWINLVTDSLPAIALGLEPPERDIMRRRPTKHGSSMFSDGMGRDILLEGGMIGALALLGAAIGLTMGGAAVGRTVCFAVLGLSQLTHALNIRSGGSIFAKGLFTNRLMLPAIGVCTALQLAVIMLPGVSDVFRTVPLTLSQWCVVLLLSLVPLAAVEAAKRMSSR